MNCYTMQGLFAIGANDVNAKRCIKYLTKKFKQSGFKFTREKTTAAFMKAADLINAHEKNCVSYEPNDLM